MRDNEILHTHVIVFRIVHSDEGYVRPWRKTVSSSFSISESRITDVIRLQDPAVPPLLTPTPLQEVIHPSHHLVPLQPRFRDYGNGNRGGAVIFACTSFRLS